MNRRQLLLEVWSSEIGKRVIGTGEVLRRSEGKHLIVWLRYHWKLNNMIAGLRVSEHGERPRRFRLLEKPEKGRPKELGPAFYARVVSVRKRQARLLLKLERM